MHVSYSEASCKLVHQFWHCFCLSSHDYITLLTFTCKIFPGIGRVLYKLTSKLNLIRSLPLSAHCPEVDQILFVRITCSYVHFFFHQVSCHQLKFIQACWTCSTLHFSPWHVSSHRFWSIITQHQVKFCYLERQFLKNLIFFMAMIHVALF